MRAHFILFVRDQERSTEFYRATLDAPPRLNVPGMTEFDLPGGAVLGLMPEAGAARLLGSAFSAAGAPRPTRSELYLLVPDPASFHRRALAAGAREASALAARDWGDEAAYSLDPDGHVLAFARESRPPVSPVSGVAIRPATPGDVPLVLQLIRELAEYERLADELVATEDGLREALFGARAVAEVVIAELDGAPVGYALFFRNFSTFLGRAGMYLEDIFVRPECRGRGIGAALLGHVAALAVERRCERLEWVVLGWNVSAIRFYENLGARPMSDWLIYRLDGDALRGAAKAEPRG